LTALIPALFQLDEGLSGALQTLDLSPEEETLVRDAVSSLLDLLNPEQREIVASVGLLKDAELADLLGVSRPTVIKRRQEVSALVVSALEGLEQSLKDLVVLELRDALGVST
jgi:DNA-directed RNA polymerase specialized sigma24 family protein